MHSLFKRVFARTPVLGKRSGEKIEDDFPVTDILSERGDASSLYLSMKSASR